MDGGLKCFGHPIGASGLRMLYEMYNQLLDRWPEERRVKEPQIRVDPQPGRHPGDERVQRGDHRPLTEGHFTTESTENQRKDKKIYSAIWKNKKKGNKRKSKRNL